MPSTWKKNAHLSNPIYRCVCNKKIYPFLVSMSGIKKTDKKSDGLNFHRPKPDISRPRQTYTDIRRPLMT